MVTPVGTAIQSAIQPTSTNIRAGGDGRLLAAENEADVTAPSNAQDALSAPPTERTTPDVFNVLLQEQEDGANNVLSAELTEEEEEQVRELQQTDREVRSHEQAHKTVGGPYAGVVSYETVTGPDGREYAVAGEVDIDTSPIPNNPEATIRKLEIVIRAALAPAEPSPQDIQVAQAAQTLKLQAQRELQEQRQAEQAEARGDGDNQTPIDRLLQQANSSEAEGIDENSESTSLLDDFGTDEAQDIINILFSA